MTKFDIVNELAQNKVIEEIITNIKGSKYSDDLAQDLYLNLMEKDEKLLQHLYESKQLKWFIIRMVLNNVKSLNSPFFSNYIKYDICKSDNTIPEVIDEDTEE